MTTHVYKSTDTHNFHMCTSQTRALSTCMLRDIMHVFRRPHLSPHAHQEYPQACSEPHTIYTCTFPQLEFKCTSSQMLKIHTSHTSMSMLTDTHYLHLHAARHLRLVHRLHHLHAHDHRHLVLTYACLETSLPFVYMLGTWTLNVHMHAYVASMCTLTCNIHVHTQRHL